MVGTPSGRSPDTKASEGHLFCLLQLGLPLVAELILPFVDAVAKSLTDSRTSISKLASQNRDQRLPGAQSQIGTTETCCLVNQTHCGL